MINCHTKKNKKRKSKKRFVGLNWKIPENRGILKHIWWEVIQEKLMFRMLWNTLRDGLHHLQNESVSMKVFPLSMHGAIDFIWSGQSYMSFNLWHILNFFYKNYWSCLSSSSKCRQNICHGNIKFWFSRNAYTGRHCLLLQINLSY